MEQNIRLSLKKVKDCVYEIQVPLNSTLSQRSNSLPSSQLITKVVKLGLSGGLLVAKVGGGYFDFLEYLDRKGVLVNQEAQAKMCNDY